MEIMGYRNVSKVFDATAGGKLLKLRSDNVPTLDGFALNVLLFMAANTYDYPREIGNPDIPSRCYDGGWKKIARTLGLLYYYSSGNSSEDSLIVAGRRNTARSRISRAWKFLQSQGLIVRLIRASLGERSTYVLMLGDNDENAEVLKEAKEFYRLPTADEIG